MKNGWTPERKARQAELIRTWKPWESSTGARSQAGKAISSRNAAHYRFFDIEMRASFIRTSALIREMKKLKREMRISAKKALTASSGKKKD